MKRIDTKNIECKKNRYFGIIRRDKKTKLSQHNAADSSEQRTKLMRTKWLLLTNLSDVSLRSPRCVRREKIIGPGGSKIFTLEFR